MPWPVLECGPLSFRYGRSHYIYYSKRVLSVGRLLLYGVEYCDKALIDSHNTVEHEAAVEFHPSPAPLLSQEWLPERPKHAENPSATRPTPDLYGNAILSLVLNLVTTFQVGLD